MKPELIVVRPLLLIFKIKLNYYKFFVMFFGLFDLFLSFYIGVFEFLFWSLYLSFNKDVIYS
jgi:hypothetical protein